MNWEVSIGIVLNSILIVWILILYKFRFKDFFLSLVMSSFYYIFYWGASLTYLSHKITANSTHWFQIQTIGTTALLSGFILASLILSPSTKFASKVLINDCNRW